MVNIPEEICPYMPSRSALRKRISRVRKAETPPEPQSIAQVNIPESLCVTLNGECFLFKEHIIDQERIFIFTTKNNIQHLSQAIFGGGGGLPRRDQAQTGRWAGAFQSRRAAIDRSREERRVREGTHRRLRALESMG